MGSFKPMSRGQEYRSNHIPFDQTVPPTDWSVPVGNPLPPGVQHALQHGEISDEVRDIVAAEIDKLLADGGVAQYLGAVRRLYTIYSKVPSIATITEELNYFHGVPFAAYEKGKNEYTIPVTEDAVSTWKQKRDQIVEMLLGYGTRWAPWYFNNMSDYLTVNELKSFAKETVFKIVTFNWDMRGQSRSGRTQGINIIHHIMASMKKMFVYHEFYKVRPQNPEFLYDDQRPSRDGEPLYMEDKYLVSEDDLPEPERQLGGTPKFLRPRADESRDGITDTPYPSAKDLQKISLGTIFAIMRTLSPTDQYLLFSYFGYINQGMRQPEISAKVSVCPAEMSAAWHRLHSAAVRASHPVADAPAGTLSDWIRSLDPTRIARQVLEKKGDHSALFHLIHMMQHIGNETSNLRLDPDAQDMMDVIMNNLVYAQNGTPTRNTIRICEALSTKFGVAIRVEDLNRIINEILIPQVETGGTHPNWLQKYLKRKKAMRSEQTMYGVFHGLSFWELAPETQNGLLQGIKEEWRTVIVLAEGLDRNGMPRTYQEVADKIGVRRQRIQQIVKESYAAMANSYCYSAGGSP